MLDKFNLQNYSILFQCTFNKRNATRYEYICLAIILLTGSLQSIKTMESYCAPTL